MTLFALIGTTITFPSASAFNGQYSRKREPLQPRQTPEEEKYSKPYNFTQLRDHLNPSAGVFEQRYFFSDQYYKGQGSPIIITTPGEQSADEFSEILTDLSFMNEMLKRFGAAGVVLEHRYWGTSLPFGKLTTASENYKFLTVDQAIDDYKYFVENADLPWARGNGSYNSKPSVTPWVNIGCSYAGQLVTLVQQQHPDLFAAGYATSAPLKADGDFWEYWKPIEAALPKNCSSDLTAAVAYMDKVMSTGTPDAITTLKEQFGIEAQVANDDFGNKLLFPFTQWQEAKPWNHRSKQDSKVFKLCDAIEGSNTSAEGIGMPHALDNWAKKFKAWYSGASWTPPNLNPEMYTNTVGFGGLPWYWLFCTQLGWFHAGNHGKGPSIASNQITPAYNERSCNSWFPRAEGSPGNYNLSKSADDFNAKFKGWNVVVKNLYTVGGEFDPWRPVSLLSDSAPPFVNTSTQRATIIPNGIHCWDWLWSDGNLSGDIRNVQNDVLKQLGIWLNDWYKSHPGVVKPVPAMRVQTIGEAYDINETQEAVLNNLEEKVNDLSTKTLTRTSYGLNGVLALSAIVALVFFVITRRAKAKSSSIPRWSTENAGGIPQRELGEKYQHLKDQTV
ncbi:hypothetical protein FRC04_007087 [Tulasnella sp. 424]|nr:hypothetical protein FRC04_007087 [Tulasnella sp. 424]